MSDPGMFSVDFHIDFRFSSNEGKMPSSKNYIF